MAAPTVFMQTKTVERLLLSAQLALSSASLMAWLSGPMTANLQRRAQERFLGQGEDVQGGGWKNWEPLKSTTVAIRAALGYGPLPINVRSGALQKYATQSNSMVTALHGGAALVYPGSSPTGSTADAFKTAQAGASAAAGRSPTPKRPVIGLGTPDLEFALVSLNAWLTTAITTGSGR